MSDVASASSGAKVVLATCCDDKHPFFNVLDNDEGTFMSTTGMYPHELVVQLAKPCAVSKIKMMTTNVRRLVLERGDSLDRFEKVFDIELPDRAGRQQSETHQVNFNAAFVKFTIASGWDQFATVHRLNVTGDA
ncbi:heat shock protein beta-11 [Pseudoscourfieldia marina]